MEIYPAGEKPIEGISSDLIFSGLKDSGKSVEYFRDIDQFSKRTQAWRRSAYARRRRCVEDRRRNITKNLSAKISSIVSGLKTNEPLKNHTTYHIGGPADYFVEANNSKEILSLFILSKKEKTPLFVLGGGSNVLFYDRGFRGIVVKLSGEFKEYSFNGETLVTGAGASSAAVLKAAASNELSGLECLAGVPGTIGGAIVGNAGTKDEWIGSIVESVEAINEEGQAVEIPKEKIDFSYRDSSLKKLIIIKAKINLKKSPKNDIFNKIENNISAREKSQPLGSWNAGSVFKNPDGFSAGKLIEEAGLKGLQFGGAKVSEKHGNFILNVDNAKASDVLELIKVIREKVNKKFNINLELEIKLIA